MTNSNQKSYAVWLAVKIIVFTILVPGTWALLVPYFLAKRQLFVLIGSAHGWHLTGWLFVGFGVLLAAISTLGFAIIGRGTPAPIDPPKQLVIKGAHSYTRNPMYISIVSFVFGLAVLSELLNLFYYDMGLFLLFHLFVVLYEEPTLKKKFGADYEDYFSHVPRWWFLIHPYR